MSIYREHTADLNNSDLQYINQTVAKAKESKTSLLQGFVFSLIVPLLIYFLHEAGVFSSQVFTVSIIGFLIVIAAIMGYSFLESLKKIQFYRKLKNKGEKRAVTGVITDKKIPSDWNSADEDGAKKHLVTLGDNKEIVTSPTQFDTVKIGDKITATYDISEEFNFMDQSKNKQVDRIVKHRKKL